MQVSHTSLFGQNQIEGVVHSQKKKGDYVELSIGSVLVYSKDSFSLGDTVSCEGKIEEPQKSFNFYLFSYEKYLASKSIYYVMNGTCQKKKENKNPWYTFKNWVIRRIEERKSKAYLKTFLLGNQEEISSEVKESYQENGISHLFSLSGLHIGFFSFLLFSGKKKKKSFWAFLFFTGYFFLADFSPSLLRACFFPFFAAILEKFLISRKRAFLFFTLLLLLWNPYLLYHPGFLYSFTISFFLMQVRIEGGYFEKIGKISLLAFISSVPIQLATNFSLSIKGPFLNLLFVPLISFLLFPLSFLVFLFPILDSFYFFLLTKLESLSLFLANGKGIFFFPYPSWWFLFGYYAFLFYFLHQKKKKAYDYSVFFLLLLLLKGSPYLSCKGKVVMLDVGQGDSTLVLYPHQKISLLIDTGGIYSKSLSEQVLLPTLHAFGVDTLDFLILTHGDFDHAGEALSLVEQGMVRKVILNSGNDNSLEEELLNYLKKRHIPYQKVSQEKITYRGEELFFLNTKREEEENEDSLVLLLQIQNHSLLFMGDSGFLTEEYLEEEYLLPKVDILKVGHHGSKGSSSQSFLNQINPSYCLISAGQENRYGHPHEETLKRLENCRTYITSKGGAIKIEIGQSLRVSRAR